MKPVSMKVQAGTMRPSLAHNPAVLLLVTGTLVGLSLPLGKVAGEAGISPVIWAMVFSLGACGMLFPVLLAKRRLVVAGSSIIRYVVISALISFVGPNMLLFSVIPHAGSGYTGLMFALSPVFTLALALLFRLNMPKRGALTGIAIGLVGAVIVSITRGASPDAPPLMWIFAALSIPMFLACGNIYRTLDWPDGALPDVLAFWSHVVAVTIYILLLFVTQGMLPLHELTRAPWATVAQILVAGITFPFFFRLQQLGGPVLLSQIGYIAAVVGLVVATGILGEQYSLMTWAGAGVIALGIFITIRVQVKAP